MALLRAHPAPGCGRGVKASMAQVFFIGSLLDLGLLTYAMEAMLLTAGTGWTLVSLYSECCPQSQKPGRRQVPFVLR